jgi:hypothetical protein
VPSGPGPPFTPPGAQVAPAPRRRSCRPLPPRPSKAGRPASSHRGFRTARRQPSCRDPATAPDGADSRSRPPRQEPVTTVMRVERHRAFHPSTAPAVNYAHRWLGTAPVPAAASPRASQLRASAAANTPTGLAGHESHNGPSLEATTNTCTRIQILLPTIRPPPGSRETGLNMQTGAFGTRLTLKAAFTIPHARQRYTTLASALRPRSG